MEIMEEVVIVGAGIAGLATALGLERVGIKALVVEKAEALRSTGTAISLSSNAWVALDALGVSHKLTSLYSTNLSVSVTNVATGAVQEVLFPQNIGPRTLHRKALLEALAEELPADSIRFSSKITSIQMQQEGGASYPVLCLEDGTTIKSKILIGCDGLHSVVAKWLGLSTPVHSGRSAVRGLAVYPQGHGFKQQVYQFVDVGKRAGFVPLNDKELYWFLACHEEKDIPRDPETILKLVTEKYANNFPSQYLDVVGHADLSSLSWAPLILRNPLSVAFGKVSKGTVTVAGDAMHPTTPDLGQGGGLALEDAVVLVRHIGNSFIRNGRKLEPEEVARALDGYVKERRWRAAWIITGSYFSGWVQQEGSNRLMKFLRDTIFYRFLFPRLVNVVQYDCGTLPTTASSKKD